jgi:hypothetical protein
MSFTDNSYFSDGDFPEEHQDSLQDTLQEHEPPSLVSPNPPNRRKMTKSRNNPTRQSDAVHQRNAALAAAGEDPALSDDGATIDAKTLRKIEKLEAENKLLKVGQRQNKRAKKEENKQALAQIRGVVKDNLWRTTKFVTSPNQQDAFINKVWEGLDYSDAMRAAMGEATWKLQFGSSCLTALNEERSYAVGRLRKAAWQKMADGGGFVIIIFFHGVRVQARLTYLAG